MAFANRYDGKRVLVTGHTGFKGAWLAQWLLDLGAEVTGLSLPPPTQPSVFETLQLSHRLTHVEGDIRDLKMVREIVREARPEFIFHLAAQPLVRLSYREPVETYATNVMGTVHVLEAIRDYVQGGNGPVAAVFATTDKCYENREWIHSYREEDPLGGYDPYSSSKGAAELAIGAYRRSYFSPQKFSPSQGGAFAGIASARAGNVIGGGDWAPDRIMPDCVRSLIKGEAVPVRNKVATRPWQHVLEPLSGYLWLGARIDLALRGSLPGALTPLCAPFNFGPALDSNRTVANLVDEALKHWPGHWVDRSEPDGVHEANLLNLATDKAFHFLGWSPAWNFETTVEKTISWYRKCILETTADPITLTNQQIAQYSTAAADKDICWAR